MCAVVFALFALLCVCVFVFGGLEFVSVSVFVHVFTLEICRTCIKEPLVYMRGAKAVVKGVVQ